MKKLKLIIYSILFIIFITMQLLSSLNRIVLFAKHFSVFLILVMVSYDVVTKLAAQLIKNYQLKGIKETLVLIGRVTTFAVLIISISHLQYRYIKLKEIPYTEGCKYYDQYNNLIYQSHYALSCPLLTIYSNDSNTLSFDVIETNKFNVDKYSFNEVMLEDDIHVDFKRLTSVMIHYNEKQQINSIDYKVTTLQHVTTDNYDDYHAGSFHKVIKNDYSNAVFNQTVLTANGYFNSVPSTIAHQSFETSDYEQINYYTVIEDQVNRPSGINTYYNLIKEYTENDQVITEDLARFVVHVYSDDYPSTIKASYSININEKHDFLESKRIIGMSKEDYELYEIQEYSESGVYDSNSYYYRQTEQYDQLLYRNPILIQKNDEEKFEAENNYSITTDVNGSDYLIAKSKEIKNTIHDSLFKSHRDETIYLIEPTDYGNKVHYKELRDQTYIDYLIDGELNLEDYPYPIYFEKSYQNSDTLFNIEYELENTTQKQQLFYRNLPFLLLEE